MYGPCQQAHLVRVTWPVQVTPEQIQQRLKDSMEDYLERAHEPGDANSLSISLDITS